MIRGSGAKDLFKGWTMSMMKLGARAIIQSYIPPGALSFGVCLRARRFEKEKDCP